MRIWMWLCNSKRNVCIQRCSCVDSKRFMYTWHVHEIEINCIVSKVMNNAYIDKCVANGIRSTHVPTAYAYTKTRIESSSHSNSMQSLCASISLRRLLCLCIRVCFVFMYVLEARTLQLNGIEVVFLYVSVSRPYYTFSMECHDVDNEFNGNSNCSLMTEI